MLLWWVEFSGVIKAEMVGIGKMEGVGRRNENVKRLRD
jgi:hypothetical protein